MKVFLSSTYKDLIEYRAKASQAIERLGQQGIRMEVFGARPEEVTTASLEEVALSDAFIGIYAHRYGTVLTDSQISITELEFNYAKEKKKPVFCFVVDEDFPWPPRHVEGEPGQSKLKAFKDRIKTPSDTFKTPEDLAYKIASSLGRFLITSKVKADLEEISKKHYTSTESGRNQVARRAARLESIIRGGRVLLVNDIPSEMAHVIGLLQALSIEVQVAKTSEEAISLIGRNTFDVVVSDMRRGSMPDEGMRFLRRIRINGIQLRTIFTVGNYEPEKGTPAHAFGITNRVDELLNLIFDAFERARG